MSKIGSIKRVKRAKKDQDTDRERATIPPLDDHANNSPSFVIIL